MTAAAVRDRRLEPRYFIAADAVLRRVGDRDGYSAVTMNISRSGLFVEFIGACELAVGDAVTCELSLPGEKSVLWGTGRVLRSDKTTAAIYLRGRLRH